MSPSQKKIIRFEKKHRHFPDLSVVTTFKCCFQFLAGSKKALALFAALNLVVGFMYLTQTNLTATSGYQIKGLSKELARLQEDNRRLSLQYIGLQSMDKIESSAKNLNLVPVQTMDTIVVSAKPVAINRK